MRAVGTAFRQSFFFLTFSAWIIGKIGQRNQLLSTSIFSEKPLYPVAGQ